MTIIRKEQRKLEPKKTRRTLGGGGVDVKEEGQEW